LHHKPEDHDKGTISNFQSCEHRERHTKKGTFEKPPKNWRNPGKKITDRNWTITTCLL